MTPHAIVPLTHRDELSAATTAVAGEAPLVRVIRSVQHAVADGDVVVATQPGLAASVQQCLRAAGLPTAVAVTLQPGLRHHVIRAGLKHLAVQLDSREPVLVCDHRHPLAPAEVADRVLAALVAGSAVAVPMMAVTDSVKTVDERGSVLSTVDRAALRTVQSPRGFTAAVLWDLTSGSPTTADEFASAVQAGLDVGMVLGDANGFQVDLPRDAPLLEAVIACRPG